MSGKEPQATSSLKIYFRLLSYVRPYIGMFLLSIVGFLIFAATQPMLAGILKYFVDGLAHPDAKLFPNAPWAWLRDLSLLYAVPLLVVLIAVWQGVGSFLGNYFIAKVSLGLVQDLRVALFNNLLTLPNRYFDNNNSGHLISRITFNVTMVTGAATDAIKVVIREGMTVVFLFLSLLWMNWKLTLVMLAILPVIALMVTSASRSSASRARRSRWMGDVTHVSSETIQGYRVVRSFGGEPYERQRFQHVTSENTNKNLRMNKTSAIYTPMLQLVIYSAMAVLLYFVLLLRGDATVGDLVAYISMAGLLPKPIRQLSEVSSTIQKGVAGAESIFEQLDEQPEVDNGTVERDRVQGRLEVKNLSFTYPGTEKKVLNDLNFSVEPGQMVALVGRSGSGKSTLANLIPRFYDHSEGQILLDGTDVEDYKLSNLRTHIALVTQQVNLFNDSVLNNIAYGDLASKPREAVEKAAEDAFAREFIDRLPERLRDRGRRERRDALRRSAPAPGNCPRLAQGCAGADPRRGDFGAGHRVRATHPGRPGEGHGRSHHAGHRPPPEHHRGSGPDPGDGPGSHRRARQPRRADRAERLLRPSARPPVRRRPGRWQRADRRAAGMTLERNTLAC